MIRRRISSVLLSVPMFLGAVLLGATSPALAGAPPRAPWGPPSGTVFSPFQDTLRNDPCGFPVSVTVLSNQQVATTLIRKNGTTTILAAGLLTVRVANGQRSLDLNISGPTHLTINSDGSVTQLALGFVGLRSRRRPWSASARTHRRS